MYRGDKEVLGRCDVKERNGKEAVGSGFCKKDRNGCGEHSLQEKGVYIG